MKNRGEHKVLQRKDGKYFIALDITVEEWREMLLNDEVFYPEARDMVIAWYLEENHTATSKAVMVKYYPDHKGSPYNGIVKKLTNNILKYLNYRFWVEDSFESGKESFWSIPFEGWYSDDKKKGYFVWKLRDEVVEAIESIPNYIRDHPMERKSQVRPLSELESFEVVKGASEGRRIRIYSTKYERKPQNRDAAIALAKKKHGRPICEACGFDFEAVYGTLGHDFIEVHHNKPLFEQDGEVSINPATDLNCLCSNCHRMVHRNKDRTRTVKQLSETIQKQKKRNV